ncbi:MAG: hypothetical protein SO122_06245 [Eubacteriales bacterium]|nr:hypothetical protein [Eubacteriales bacterium]
MKIPSFQNKPQRIAADKLALDPSNSIDESTNLYYNIMSGGFEEPRKI